MSNSPLEVLEHDEQTSKRACWEAFEFTLLGGGDIEVVNGSHEGPAEHTYTVHVEGDIPSDCTCPAWEYQEGACKHMVAVAIREPVLEAVTAEPSMDTKCDCDELSDDFPCWPCFRRGRRELP